MSSISSAAGSTQRLIRQIERNGEGVQRSLERLSTGKRINRPADDPAGFVAAEELRGELTRLSAELRGVRRERNVLRIEQSGLSAIRDRLNELRGLVLESAGNVISHAERDVLDAQITDSLQALDDIEGRIAQIVKRQGGTPADLPGLREAARISQRGDVVETADAVDRALDEVNISQAGAAAHDRYLLETRQVQLEDAIVIHTEALSLIEDADFAEEASNLALSQTLEQASLAALQLTTSTFAEQLQALILGADEAVDEAAVSGR